MGAKVPHPGAEHNIPFAQVSGKVMISTPFQCHKTFIQQIAPRGSPRLSLLHSVRLCYTEALSRETRVKPQSQTVQRL